MATLNYIVSCLALLGIVGFTNGLALNNQFLNSPNRLNKGSNGLGSSTTTASSNEFRLKVQFMNGQESQGDTLFGAGVDYYLDLKSTEWGENMAPVTTNGPQAAQWKLNGTYISTQAGPENLLAQANNGTIWLTGGTTSAGYSTLSLTWVLDTSTWPWAFDGSNRLQQNSGQATSTFPPIEMCKAGNSSNANPSSLPQYIGLMAANQQPDPGCLGIYLVNDAAAQSSPSSSVQQSYPILLTDGRLVFAIVFKAPWSKFGDGDGVVKEGTVGWISGNQICTFVLHEKEFAKVHGIDQSIQPNDEQSSGPPWRAQRQGGAKKAKASESGGGAKKAKAFQTGDKDGKEGAKKA